MFMLAKEIQAGCWYYTDWDCETEQISYVSNTKSIQNGIAIQITYHYYLPHLHPGIETRTVALPPDHPFHVAKRPAEDDEIEDQGDVILKFLRSSICECGAHKCGFPFHSDWCPIAHCKSS